MVTALCMRTELDIEIAHNTGILTSKNKLRERHRERHRQAQRDIERQRDREGERERGIKVLSSPFCGRQFSHHHLHSSSLVVYKKKTSPPLREK